MAINFKRGDIVNASGQIGVIVDVLESTETDNICLYVHFVHNLGNVQPYDVLELLPGRMMGVDKWIGATREDLEQALVKRRAKFEQEIKDLVNLAGGSKQYFAKEIEGLQVLLDSLRINLFYASEKKSQGDGLVAMDKLNELAKLAMTIRDDIDEIQTQQHVHF